GLAAYISGETVGRGPAPDRGEEHEATGNDPVHHAAHPPWPARRRGDSFDHANGLIHTGLLTCAFPVHQALGPEPPGGKEPGSTRWTPPRRAASKDDIDDHVLLAADESSPADLSQDVARVDAVLGGCLLGMTQEARVDPGD